MDAINTDIIVKIAYHVYETLVSKRQSALFTAVFFKLGSER